MLISNVSGCLLLGFFIPIANVTCILKSLVESGEMILSDGRRIVPTNSPEAGDNIIHLHPSFRMIVLANRPGFPFLVAGHWCINVRWLGRGSVGGDLGGAPELTSDH